MKSNERKTPAEEMSVVVDLRVVKPLLSCQICSKLMKQATSITLCLDHFCWECIYDYVTEHGGQSCPVCGVYLGSRPLSKIRRDQQYERLINTIFPQEKKEVEMESKTSDVSSSSSA
ncbi:unnamed protein product [Microthlaspi erraticum]|uniref:RING-type domain-containing protein n=1 Tax=Microthlaspi erraticum TaxID=1685480 RepID=A0A6D2IS87_9BRAS|nr:unnamed protein product [Microthlaspi erraticum]